MQWLVGLLWGLVVQLGAWLIGRGLDKVVTFFAFSALTLGLFTAFLVATFEIVMALQVAAPEGIGFILSLLPPRVALYLDAYLTVYILRRVYDYKTMTLMQAAQLSSVKLPKST